MPTYNPFDVIFERGEGSYLFDKDGKKYLDFSSGLAVTALGHSHPKLVEALHSQVDKLWHLSNMFRIPAQEKLAERLVDETFADSVFFTNSGVEAIECAMKLARKYYHDNNQPERYRIITFENSFHGRSLATIAAAGKEKLVNGFGPMPDWFDHVPFLDLAALEAVISDETAALMIEPIQGEGGIRLVSDEDMRALRQIADDRGLLLILDEVQCGMGRTGKLFAHEWSGIKPDIITIAKGIGGGFPVGACLATSRVATVLSTGSHGTTYGGNPLAMAVGNAVLDEILSPGFLDNIDRVSGMLMEGLQALKRKYEGIILDIRGKGLMIGVECSLPIRPLQKNLIETGMIAAAAGPKILRLLPPLNIKDEEITEALEKLDGVFSRAHLSEAPAAS